MMTMIIVIMKQNLKIKVNMVKEINMMLLYIKHSIIQGRLTEVNIKLKDRKVKIKVKDIQVGEILKIKRMVKVKLIN